MVSSIKWAATGGEYVLIANIIKRLAAFGYPVSYPNTEMDLTACHLNGCPLDLKRMSKAGRFDLFHDINGIERNINRDTGKLSNAFRPRFASNTSAACCTGEECCSAERL